ncbi:uncharacterized protein LOC135837296 [Planococcus citri]|uniref:uncharacterized protein LOC135837296 n=1 Tax=Planococcus citri TaxID=170843 RepID=UPI0031F77F67
MDYRTKFSFFVLFILKEILSTQSTNPSTEYDITSSLPDWIAKILETDQALNVNDAVKAAFASAEHHRVQVLEYNITHAVEPFQSKVVFYDTNFYTHPVDAAETLPFTLHSWKSSGNTICLSTPKFRITLEGEIRAERDQFYASYFTTLHFEKFVLNAIRVTNDPNDVQFSYMLSFENYYVYHHGSSVDIKWPQGDLTEDQKTELNNAIKPMMPLLLGEHMIRNPRFSETFDRISKTFNQPSEIISAHPNFLNHREQYYYLVPEIPFYGFTLNNVVIQGVLNIDSFDMNKESPIFTHTLLMKNIQGSMTLNYGSEHRAPLGLKYAIDYLSISTKEGTDIVHVEAKSYSVNRTSGAALSYRQSANIIQKIESAVVASLLPAKRAWKTYDMEPEIGQIQVTNASDWKQIEKTYSNWIPFNNEVHNIVPMGVRPWFVQRIFYAAGGRFMMGR